MKRVLLIMMLVCAWQSVSAQKIRFTDTSNKWTEHWSNWNNQRGRTETSQYKGTTVYNGIEYLYTNYLIREDTTLNKVFVRYPIGSLDTAEHVLYDYSLVVGDTLMNWLVKSWRVDTFKHIVRSIDTVWINAIAYKMWKYEVVYANYPDNYPGYRVIEGIVV